MDVAGFRDNQFNLADNWIHEWGKKKGEWWTLIIGGIVGTKGGDSGDIQGIDKRWPYSCQEF